MKNYEASENDHNRSGGNKTWHHNESQKKESRAKANEEPGAVVPVEVARGGKFVSRDAKVVYVVLRSYNPCRPSLKTIASNAGIGKTNVAKALNELEAKNLISRNSGQAHRAVNFYRFPRKIEWNIFELPLVPVKGKKSGKFKKTLVRETNQAGSPDEPGAGSPGELELDQFQIDQLNTNIALRYESNGQSQGGENVTSDKGVPSGESITNPARKFINELDQKAREAKDGKVGSMKFAISMP